MKVHRVVLLVVDHDDLGAEGVVTEIEAVDYPNHCISPRVMEMDTREVEWSDAHPLNRSATREAAAAFRTLFKKESP